MKLKSQLIITLSILILISVIIISAIIIANEKLQNTNRNEKLIIDIESGYFELSHLESDYLINKGDREIEQWRSKYAIISDQIDELQLEDPDEKSLSANMKAGHVQLEPLFSDFISDRNSAGSTGPVASRDERQGFQWSSLAMQMEKVTYDADELMRLLRADATATLEWFNIIILLSISMLLVSSVISYALITRSVIESLLRLRSGIELVGSGELDARVDTGTDDELGDLALLFNKMADKLKMVMARKSELEKEISERKKAEAAMQRGKRFTDAIFESIPGILYMFDGEGSIVRWNTQLEKITGYSAEDLAHLPVSDLFTGEDTGRTERAIQEAFTKGSSTVEAQIVTKDGRKIPLSFTGVRTTLGDSLYITGVGIDITERKKAEEALRESEGVLQSMLDAAPVGIGLIVNRLLQKVNHSLCTITGYSEEEMIGQNTRMLYPDDEEYLRIGRELYGQMEREGIGTVEGRLKRKDGAIITVILNLTPFDLLNPSAGVTATVLDITEQKRDEEAINTLSLFQTSIISNANVWLMVLDPQGNIQTWNRAAEDISGYGEQEVMGNSTVWKKLYPDKEYRKTITKNIGRIISENNYLENLETVIHCKNGTEKTILWNTRSLPDEKGAATGYVAIGVDITERKKAEELQKHFSEELEKQVLSRTGELNASLQEKVVLLREIHHRVKNNLQIVISLLNLQSRYIEDAATQQIIKESQNRLMAMALVHEKLYQSDDISKIDLDGYVKFLGRNLFDFYGVRRQDVALKTDISGISVGINTAIPIGLILNELLSNSFKHAFPEGRKGEISIAVKRENSMLTILFKDTGAGIPVDLDWRTGKSLGLRLIIVLVEQLFGTIELDLTAGTAFTIVVKEKE
jgi:PAS domain S-box-containing protein